MVRNLSKLIGAILLISSIQVAHALNVSLDVVFTDSDYQVDSSDSFADLLAAHNAANIISTTNVDALDGIDTSVYAGNINGDYSVLMMATLDIEMAGNYEFKVGTDWGRGGGVALFDTATNTLLHEQINATDIWWANNWNHSDVITSNYALSQNEYTIMWLGFEGCCAGSSTIGFSYEGGAFQIANVANLTPHVVPIPASIYLFGAAMLAMGASRHRNQRPEENTLS